MNSTVYSMRTNLSLCYWFTTNSFSANLNLTLLINYCNCIVHISLETVPSLISILNSILNNSHCTLHLGLMDVSLPAVMLANSSMLLEENEDLEEMGHFDCWHCWIKCIWSEQNMKWICRRVGQPHIMWKQVLSSLTLTKPNPAASVQSTQQQKLSYQSGNLASYIFLQFLFPTFWR